jgi:hypothetical protein
VCTSALTPVLAEVLITGTKELNENGQIQIYPNPASEFITLSTAKTINSNVQINIIDVAGRLAQQVSYNNMQAQVPQQIDISKLSKGVYFVKLSAGSEQHIQKLIIK